MIKIKHKNYTCKYRDFDTYSKYNFLPNNNNKLYNTELILITNSMDIEHIIFWLKWHINIIGFEHVFLIDNSANDDYSNQLISLFGQKVTYEKRIGKLTQTLIYNEILSKTQSQWVLPIDDDEFLYISDKYGNNINVFLNSMEEIYPAYKYSFNWHMMFADSLLQMNNNNYINSFKYFCPHISTNDVFNMVKTIINTSAAHLYLSDENNVCSYFLQNELNLDNINKPIYNDKNAVIGSLHNPISKVNNKLVHAYNYETDSIILGFVNNGNLDIKSDIYICHYKYRDKTSWNNKCKNFKFTDVLLDYTSVNYRYDTIDNVYNIIKNDLILHDDIHNLAIKYGI